LGFRNFTVGGFDLNLVLFPLTMVLFFLVVFLGFNIFVKLAQGKGKMIRALNMSLFLVSVPKISTEEKAKKPFKELVAVMEQFYASLSNLKEKGAKAFWYGQQVFALELAVPHVGEEICFYVACPKRLAAVIEKQIHGFFPTAEVKPVKDYNIFNPEGVSCGAALSLSRGVLLPFKTYQNLEADPLNEIANALSKLEIEGEGAAIQIIIRPTKRKRWRKLALKIAKEMQQGKTYDAAKMKVKRKWVNDLMQTASPKSSKPPTPSPLPSVTPVSSEIIKALEAKGSKVVYEVNINLVASAKLKEQAEQILLQLESAFAQFNSANLNNLRPMRAGDGQTAKKLFYNFSFRMFDEKRRMILSTEELASLFHFPTTDVETPKVRFIRAKQAAPPPTMPQEGVVLGENIFRGVQTVVRIQRDDRRRHLYVIGQTGTGKTSFMKGMIVQDIQKGEGVAIIDPHGEFAEYVLGCVPKERVEEVVYFNPADLSRPIGLNMLEYDARNPEQKTFIVNELINIFDKLYDLKTTGGPIFEQYTRNALLLLMDDAGEGATLMDVPRVMADAAFRKRLLAKCQNIVVKDFWEKEAEKAGGEAALVNLVPYITSKFNTFIANDFMRPIIGQRTSSINFRDIMDSKKILIINLSKGRLGDINAHLLGLIIVGKLMMASFARIDTPEELRPDFYLYIDEFHNFTTDSISTILSEARKYRLCLTIGHQFIKQLPEKIRDSVFGNVGSSIAFRVGAEDAEFLVKQFTPVFDQSDLINLDNFNAYAKLLINNLTSKPFNITFSRPPAGNLEMMEALKELSALKYGHDRALIEEEIAGRYKV
jgi:hypothetical protein